MFGVAPGRVYHWESIIKIDSHTAGRRQPSRVTLD